MDEKNYVDVSSFMLFEATGDSEADSHELNMASGDTSHGMDVEPDYGNDEDDDDAESCIYDLLEIVDGSGFMARSITFENSAPPPKSHQAVALTNNANRSAFYQCVFLGYQDTLLANHNRQFYKDCDIYGSVDFVWGYAKAVFQDCRLYARRIGSDGNVVTAQGKNSPTLDSGFSFQNCKVTVDPNLAMRKSEVSVVLGRPWKDYATVVFMESFLDDIVKPEGWSIKWDNIPKPHIFYAEYNNSGPGANTSGRIKWPGYRVLTSAAEAIPFTVSKFIDGDAWIPETAVFQDCRLYARRIGSDGNMVTAQGKNSPTLDSGFSFQNCKVTVDPNLALRKSEVSVVLGRPWMDYATVVFMESFLDDIVKPEGWSIKWDNIPKPHIFYAEYNNSGPGANTSGRVKWPGYRVLTSAAEAIPFTVSKFIDGDAWIPETAPPINITFNATVAQDGSGDYTTIKAAIDAAPVGSVNRYYIHVKSGVYKDEYVTVGKDKTNIALIGDDAHNTFITGNRSIATGYTNVPETASMTPPINITFNATVAQDGSGDYTTIKAAIDAAPVGSANRYYIHVKEGVYRDEYVTVGKNKINIALIGDGAHNTVITGKRSIATGYTNVPETASMNTLLANHNRQFYKDCDIYGSVDFVWGYAKAMFQDCRLYALRIGSDGNVITAQGKDSPTFDSGFSFQNCKVTVDPELALRKSEVSVILGRPWTDYATVVFMQSFLDDIVKPEGWSISWDNIRKPYIFYAEYNNSGPGANTSGRVKWPGYRVITSAAEASRFTVSKFIDGDAWIPEMGIPYQGGLNA
ncbi:hypothetical protein C3L33_04070, partial [Rhododendron williamsianum]